MARQSAAEVDDWITPSAGGADDWITPAAPEGPSGAAAFFHHGERGAAPAVGGWAVMAAGAKLGALAGALIPGLGETGIGEAGGAIVGGVGGALGGSAGVAWAQEKLLDLIPEHVKEMIGQSKTQREAEELAHPYLSMAGELAPNLALLRPGAIATTAREGAGVLERTLSHPVGARAIGAGFGAAQEAGTELATDGEVDPGKVAIATGAGALMTHETALGRGIRTKVEGAFPSPRVHPAASPEEAAAPVLEAGTVDEAIAAAQQVVAQPPLDVEAMGATAARQAAEAAPPPAAAPPGPDWQPLYDEAGAEIGHYNVKTEEMRLAGEGAEATPGELSAPLNKGAENNSEQLKTPAAQPSARDFPPYAEAKQKVDTYNRWLGELDAQRRQEAAESPRARFLQQNIAAILTKVNGVEDRLTQSGAQRLEQARASLDGLLNPVGDSPDMARVRESMVAEQQHLADAVVAHRDQALKRAQEAREHAQTLEEAISDDQADLIADSMAAHQIDAVEAVADHIEHRAREEVQSDHEQPRALAEAEPVRGGEGGPDIGAGEVREGPAPVTGNTGVAGEAGVAVAPDPGQAHELARLPTVKPEAPALKPEPVAEGLARPAAESPPVVATSRYADLSPGVARIKAQTDALTNLRGVYRNEDTGWDIHLTKSGIRKSLSGDGSKVRAEIVANLPKLLEAAKFDETHPDTANPERTQVHRFSVDMMLDGRSNRLKLTVREDALGAKRHYAVDHVEIEPPGILAPRGQNPRGPAARENISPEVEGFNTAEKPGVSADLLPETAPKTEPAAEEPTVRAKALKAVEGTGEERERAIGGALYHVAEEAPQLAAAAKLVDENFDDAVAIAMRRKQPPAGVHPEFVYMAVEQKAVRDGNFDLQYKLRTSKIAEEATTMGQRTAAWRNRDEISPVEDMRRIDQARAAKLKERGQDPVKAAEEMVTKGRAEIKKTVKAQSLNDFVLANICPA